MEELPKTLESTNSSTCHREARAALFTTINSRTRTSTRRPRGVSRPYRLLPRRRFRNITASANAINERYFGNNVYDPLARPVADDSKAVDVHFKFLLTGIRSLNPITHTLISTALLCSFWKEPRIRWPKRYYGNISTIRATPEMIWTPDIQGPIGRSNEVQTKSFNSLINHQGNASRCVFAELRSLCRLDLASFPYDEQICRIILRPHGLSARLVNLVMNNVSESHPVQYGEWIVHAIKAYTHFNNYGPIELGTGVIEMRLKRTSAHYRWSVCIPTASLLLIALVCSWIPRRQIRTRQELLSGLLLSNVLLLRHTTVLVEGAQKLPNILVLQNFCLGLVTVNIVSTSILQGCPSPTRGGRIKGHETFGVAIGKLDVFGYPTVGALLILWTLFVA
ncbi:acetylcholine receptor subunit delta-like isoform X2 [Varroa destructor]|nr:acetylcholine receptor subunit delta-like isoform X2 [Varroa destructor]